jgi:group II intron reverse transcriptase/maturase
MISKNRNDSNPLCQGVLSEALSRLSFSDTSSLMLESNISNQSTYLTHNCGPANVVCDIDSGISTLCYYYLISFNAPLHITPMRVRSFFNLCSKKRPNHSIDTIRGFSSGPNSLEDKDRVMFSSKECSLLGLSGKADLSLLMLQNLKTAPLGRSNSHTEIFSDVVDSLRQLKPEKDGIYTLITARFLANPEFLKLAYARIKNKEGNLTSGGGNLHVSLDGISQKWFQDTALHLKNNSYEFSSTRRINITKKSSNKSRPLTIGNPKDKIIQKAIQLVLEEIYENKDNVFLDVSHGFRSNKNCHTALQCIKINWTAIPWFLSIDIKNAFGSINRDILMSRLKLKIKDQRLFDLLLKMLKADIISPTGILKEYQGVPQGNILSPILSNIYFHDLDVYVKREIIDRYKMGVKASRCLEYQRAVSLTIEESRSSLLKRKQLARRKRRDAHKAGLRYTKIDVSFIRVKYIRYADDVLIGVRGPKVLATKIFQSVSFFLKSDLHLSLNEEKSKIIDSFSSKIPFLGMFIHNVPNKHLPYRKSRALENKKRKLSRVLLRADALENRRTKLFKDECLNLLRNSYKNHRNDREPLKDNFISIIRNSPIFGDVLKNSNRAIYREFIQSLQQISDIKQSKTLGDFLDLWEKELSINTEVSKKDISQVPSVPITKRETILRIVEILKVQHNLPAHEVEWFQLFRGSNKSRGSKWKPVWIHNFSLSEGVVSKLKFPVNSIYHAKYNVENIRLAIEDLLNQSEHPSSDVFADRIPSNNIKSVRQSWDERGAFISLPPQINSNTSEVYKRLEDNSIINNKKKPISKTSLLVAEAWLIITYYNSLAHGLLSYFRCVDNLNTIKKIVTYHLRYSLLFTLAHKHKCSIKKILDTYGKNIKTMGRHGKEISFINSVFVTNLKKEFLCKELHNPYTNLSRSYISLQRAAISANVCAVKDCNITDDIEVHHIRKLFRNVDRSGKVVVQGRTNKLSGRLAMESSLKRKQLPLCSNHHKD